MKKYKNKKFSDFLFLDGEEWEKMRKNFMGNLGLTVWKIPHFPIIPHWFHPPPPQHKLQLGSRPIYYLEAFVARFMAMYKGFIQDAIMDLDDFDFDVSWWTMWL